MKIIVETKGAFRTTNLPISVTDNYWILGSDEKNLLNVVAENGSWKLNSNAEIKLITNRNDIEVNETNYIEYVFLQENQVYYAVNDITKEQYILYTLPDYENFEKLTIDFNSFNSILIGQSDKCDIIINNPFFNNKQLSIEFIKNSNSVFLKNLADNVQVFVNGITVKEHYLSNADVIFVAGTFIYFFGSLFLVNNNTRNLSYNSSKLNLLTLNENPNIDYSQYVDKEIVFFDKNKYFQRPPRFKRKIENKVFTIDPPPQKEKNEEMPLIFTIAPMITMGMMSFVSGFTALQKVIDGESTLEKEFSSLLMCGSMMLAMIIFPLAQKFYNKHRKRKKEKNRVKKYKRYISGVRDSILKEISYQKDVLLEEHLPIEAVSNVIFNRTKDLWERKLDHEDFLELRLGRGNRKPKIEVKAQEEHFSLEEDDLKKVVMDLVNESKDIIDVPITLNFRENNKVGIIGERDVINGFYNNLLLQIMAYHGYDMLRIIIFTNGSNKSYWEQFMNLPYLWNNDKSIRYFATNKDDINKVTSYLMEEYNYRKELSDENKGETSFSPYYLILTDDIASIKNNVFVNGILKSHVNLGYSIIMNVEKVNTLPNECNMFVNVVRGYSGIFTSQMSPDEQINFKPDFIDYSMKNYVVSVSNIPMDINSGKYVLPKKYGFLEMFDVGNVSQLNILNRWKNNNIIKSLETPVGIDEQGELFKIDLHEKAHGPHGLVAGTTGSGKSEWIITYILSMAVNYSPEEVQFVLIDYKGGGLALTFDNRETGVKLPHVVGTLTNLDVIEMKRSLASINSELKRRQSMFKEAREELNESSMDIYKYQELYRTGKLKVPMSHLFIISDEFAELKSQQPEFMDELISTARIGRSLGIHLVLATQKPSGVVDDQIWSNSKFRVCLKVQDKSDSQDMLKCPDAAMLKDTGRFYLQVGYNELFAKGQAAYAGMPYYESDKRISVVDSSVDFVDDIGSVVKKGDIQKSNTQYVHKGEELPNVLDYIIETAKSQTFQIVPLWLGSIPKEIYVDKLKTKYNYQKEDFILNPVVGEYDEPHKQQQNILTVPISKDGNFLLYGTGGSGKELFITTLLYSLITTYTPDEVGIYILDFGTEVLNNFVDSSHVGDIIHSGDDEKIENLFKFIKAEIDFRRKQFLSYNGSYIDYVTKSGNKMPNLVVVINYFDIFSDLYENYAENLYEITRECNKYGIYFILTVNTTNGVKSKLLQTFKSMYTLQLNNEFDYRSIFASAGNVVPSKIYGRGLFKKNNVLEFQTAYAFEKENLYKEILNASIKTFMKYKTKMKPIPVLPKIVELKDINKKAINLDFLPVGMVKKDLSVANIKFNDYLGYVLSFRNFDENISFIDKILNILDRGDVNTVVFDSKYIYEEKTFNKIKYLNSNYTSTIESLHKFITDVDSILKENNNNIRSIKNIKENLCVIVGVNKLISSLNAEDKEKLIDIITKSKDSLKIRFLFIDVPGEFKSYEYEPWYKAAINSSNGLWIGDGFADQYFIKPTKMSQSYFGVIGNNYGYLVEEGQVKFIKIIEKI